MVPYYCYITTHHKKSLRFFLHYYLPKYNYVADAVWNDNENNDDDADDDAIHIKWIVMFLICRIKSMKNRMLLCTSLNSKSIW